MEIKSDVNDYVYIISTMTGSVRYCFWKTIGDLPRLRDSILIHGGANLPNYKSGFGERTSDGEGTPMWTPSGVVTPIRKDRYEKLKDHELFKKHIAKGKITVTNKDIVDNHKAVKKITSGMEGHDGFAQLSNANYKTKIQITTDKARNISDLEKFINP